MKLSINMLKEPKDFVKKCKQREKELELNGQFNEEENENSLNNAEPVTKFNAGSI